MIYQLISSQKVEFPIKILCRVCEGRKVKLLRLGKSCRFQTKETSRKECLKKPGQSSAMRSQDATTVPLRSPLHYVLKVPTFQRRK